jgi:hypothetical protein
MSPLEKVARAICEADGENPGAFHTKAAVAAADREGLALTDHAVPLWMGYRKAARAALTALLDPDEGSPGLEAAAKAMLLEEHPNSTWSRGASSAKWWFQARAGVNAYLQHILKGVE